MSALTNNSGEQQKKNKTQTSLRKSVRIPSYSGPYFPAFGLDYGVSLRIQSEYGKIQTRITLNTDNFYAVHFEQIFL